MECCTLRFSKLAAVVPFGLLVVVVTVAESARPDVVLMQEGQQAKLDIAGASRRQVFERLLGTRGIRIDWWDSTYADEPIQGVYRGSLPDITRSILADSSFVIIYDSSAERYWISRLIVIGKWRGGGPPPGLGTVAAAMDPPDNPDGRKGLTREQVRIVGISSQEYVRRIEREGTWQLNGNTAFLVQLGRTAGATDGYQNRYPSENNSAGVPPGYVRGPETDPASITGYVQAITVQMARRNLLGLYHGLRAVTPSDGSN
jgi:hypothetical protein